MKTSYDIKYYQCLNCGKYCDDIYCDCENENVKEVNITIRNTWRDIYIGNVVKWFDNLHVVSQMLEDKCTLVPFNSSNSSVHPSVNFPANPNHRIDSLKFVSKNINTYITDSLMQSFKR